MNLWLGRDSVNGCISFQNNGALQDCNIRLFTPLSRLRATLGNVGAKLIYCTQVVHIPRTLHVRNLANDTQGSITLFLVAHRFTERHRNLNHGRSNSYTTIVFTERSACAHSAHAITNSQR